MIAPIPRAGTPVSGAVSELAVGDRRAVGHRVVQGLQHHPLRTAHPAQIQRQVELLEFAGEVGGQLVEHGRHPTWLVDYVHAGSRQAIRTTPAHARHSVTGDSDAQRSHRGRQRADRDVTERQLADRLTPTARHRRPPGRGRCPVAGCRLHELRHPSILHRTTDSRRAARRRHLARALRMSVDDPWS